MVVLTAEQKTTEVLKFELTDLRFKSQSPDSTELEKTDALIKIQEIETVIKEREKVS